ncbi:hypothetical protein LV178_11610, partial [Burkholderia mallei]|nr:hypothetical protein [Burkholderia mallei]
MAVGRTTIESRIANRTSRIAPESTHDRIARDRNIPPAGADALPDASGSAPRKALPPPHARLRHPQSRVDTRAACLPDASGSAPRKALPPPHARLR